MKWKKITGWKQESNFCFAWYKRLSKHCRDIINSSLTIYPLNPEQRNWFRGALTWDVWKCHTPGRQVHATLLNSTVIQHLQSPDAYVLPAPLRSLKSLNGNEFILWDIVSNSQLSRATLLFRSLDSRLFQGDLMSLMAQERDLISDYESHRHSVPLLHIWFRTHTKRKMSVLNVVESPYMGFDSSFKCSTYVLHDLKL